MANSPKTFCFPLFAAGLLGLTGVALGALGAHALKVTLAGRGMLPVWETAARYHLLHAAALLGAAAWVRTTGCDEDRAVVWAAGCWCAGVLLFSGSLYWLALGGPRWLGPVTPLGGVALLAGWALIAWAAFSRRKTG